MNQFETPIKAGGWFDSSIYKSITRLNMNQDSLTGGNLIGLNKRSPPSQVDIQSSLGIVPRRSIHY